MIFSTYINAGGLSGASCWSNEPPEPYTSNEEQDFSDLKNYLKKLNVNLTDSQFKNLVSKFHEGEYSEYDYYGNRDDYKVSYLSAKEIYDYVSPRNLSTREDPNLIAIIEEMGEESFGLFASLKIVEIPDDVEYEITEFDGLETIREKCRTWC